VTISAADLEARLASVETTGLPSVGAAARVDAREAAFNATLTLMASQTSRIDALVATIGGFQGSMDSITSTVNAASSTMRVDNERQMSEMRAQNSAQMTAQNAAVTAALTSMNASIAAAVAVAQAAGSPTIYVQWGRRSCTAPGGRAVRKHFDGFAWGTRHDYSGGAANVLCLKNENRPRTGSSPNDYSDIIVPLRKEVSQYTGVSALTQRNGYIIPCSRCEYSKVCYTESGTTGCATGYLPFYTGHLYGGHSGHGGVNNRICVDKDVGAGEYTTNPGTNGHMYPTVERSGVAARSRNPSAVLCYHCCKV
jgi:hypothetical protein